MIFVVPTADVTSAGTIVKAAMLQVLYGKVFCVVYAY